MPYKRRRKRHFKIPAGVLALIVALVVGLVAVIGQYEHIQNVREESMSENSAALLARKQAFIHRLVPYAKTLYVNYGVLPSITLSQAILESDWGNSKLASDYHNLFGVKASAAQNGRALTTQEYVDGQWQTVTGRFKVYPDDYASMRDHAMLLAHGTTWNHQQYAGVIAARNYQTAARALQTSGYATDPGYTNKLIAIIEKYKLDQYDTKE